MRIKHLFITFLILITPVFIANAATLVVKPGKIAIVKTEPTGTSPHLFRLPEGTLVEKIGEAPRYYSISYQGQIGWSYKGNFQIADTQLSTPVSSVLSEQGLLARTDVLKIIIVDVEVGDATLIICPEEEGVRDVILIDTGENDSDRIFHELINNGFILSEKPITRLVITHYDGDHHGDADRIVPLARIIYDHGNNNLFIDDENDTDYHTAISTAGVDRRLMTLNYHETFSGGVTIECVAVNRATDFEPGTEANIKNDNPNSIALIVSFDGFEYFTAGDIGKKTEQSLALGIRDCDVYHMNHHGSSSSSHKDFLSVLKPEVAVVSNGTKYGHPNRYAVERLFNSSLINHTVKYLFQTNINPDQRAYTPSDLKFVGDDEYSDNENGEGAKGTIRIVVDPISDKYFVVMAGFNLDEGIFNIEH